MERKASVAAARAGKYGESIMRQIKYFYPLVLSVALLSFLGCASHQTRLPVTNAGADPGVASDSTTTSNSNHPGDLALLDDPATDADPAQLTVPEPETAYLIGIGLLGLYLTRRRK